MLIRALEILKIPSQAQKLWANVILTPNGSAVAGLIKQNLVRKQLTFFPHLEKFLGLIKNGWGHNFLTCEVILKS